MKNAAFSIEELFRFLDAGVSAFHSTAAASAILEAEGYVNCPESAAWELAPGGKYYTTRNGSAVLAWRMPRGELTGWHAAASHSDSPTWRIKQFDTEDKVFAKAEVEGYGGMIMSTWLDRPLSAAGRIIVSENGTLVSKLVNLDRTTLVIPSVAIHMDRTANGGHAWNIQQDLLPLYGTADDSLSFMDAVAAAAQVAPENILGHDLYLYSRIEGTLWGERHEFISSARLDDLQCAFAAFRGFTAGKKESISVFTPFSIMKKLAAPQIRAPVPPSSRIH